MNHIEKAREKKDPTEENRIVNRYYGLPKNDNPPYRYLSENERNETIKKIVEASRTLKKTGAAALIAFLVSIITLYGWGQLPLDQLEKVKGLGMLAVSSASALIGLFLTGATVLKYFSRGDIKNDLKWHGIAERIVNHTSK